jgi:hypothetical protein
MASVSQSIDRCFYSATLVRRYCNDISLLLTMLFRHKYGICITSQWWGFYFDTLFSLLLPHFFITIAMICFLEKSIPLFKMVTCGGLISSLFPRKTNAWI